MKRKALKAAFSFVYPMFEPASLRDGRLAGSFLILFQFFSVLIRALFQSLIELPDEVAKGRHLISVA